MWATDMITKGFAAYLAFEDSFHRNFGEIARSFGNSAWRSSIEIILRAQEDSFHDKLRFTVHGLVRAFNDEGALATLVIAEVAFQRAGNSLYEYGVVANVCKSGDPC